MKKLYFLFTLLVIILLGDSHNEIKKTNAPFYFFSLTKTENIVNSRNSIVSSTSKEIGYIQKKKITKGIKQTFPFISNKTSFQVAIIESKIVIPPISFLHSNPFLGNRKRGPPSIYTIS
jgi:hypothetical protein